MGAIAGFVARFRQQVLYPDLDLMALRGKTLTGLWFRRDHAFGNPYQPSSGLLRIQLSHALRPPSSASRSFASNRGADATTVFDGLVLLPESFSSGEPAPWRSPYAVRIQFATTFPYQSGDLCIEIDGTPQNPPPELYWAVDYDQEAEAGVVVEFGSACGDPTAEYASTASAWSRNMVPGGTFSLMSVGQPQTPGVMFLGARLPGGIPLDPLGGTGCEVFVQPVLQLAQPYPSASGTSQFGVARTRIHLPHYSIFLGVNFAVQWVNLETGGRCSNPLCLTTTNALDITIASILPRGSVTTVISDQVAAPAPFPASGRVDMGRGPVVRFEYQ